MAGDLIRCRRLMDSPTNTRPSSAADAPSCPSEKSDHRAASYAVT